MCGGCHHRLPTHARRAADHNALHGAEVLQGCHYSLTRCGLGSHLEEMEAFALLLAAGVHDVAHPGLNNAFLAATRSELSVRFNDQARDWADR